MQHFKGTIIICLLLIVFMGTGACNNGKVAPAAKNKDTDYYGVKVNDVLCGYAESSSTFAEENGKKIKKTKRDIFLMTSLLGSQFNTRIKISSAEDAATGKCSRILVESRQGQIKRKVDVAVKDNIAVITITPGATERVTLSPDVCVGDGYLYRKMKADFADAATKEKTYKTLDSNDGKIRSLKVSKVGQEPITVAGKKYRTTVFQQLVVETGLKTKIWIEMENLEMLKLEVSNRTVFKTDHTVVNNIKVADRDPDILTRCNVAISDLQGISYMKVKARIEPTGVRPTPESLNVKGQSFEGTVKDNVIEGVFEIEHKPYDGTDAPPFPADFSGTPSIAQYLESDSLVQADDPVLKKKAEEITAGSKDSWEAACRLSKWVAEKITYAIPGGGTARKTYDLRAGECGAHSFLLASFCRSVGIPARVVWGAMYTPNLGGSFGQHGWNEIHMGTAGWVTVDATAFETDFVDSGHIRISEYQSASTAVNGKRFEILDHRIAAKEGNTPLTSQVELSQYVGGYIGPNTRRYAIKVEKGTILMLTPENASLPFKEPDENGRRYCSLAPHVYVVFNKDDGGKVVGMAIHEVVEIRRKTGSSHSSAKGVPKKLNAYTGQYYLAKANMDINVIYKDGGLALDIPAQKAKKKLFPTGEKDAFRDEHKTQVFLFKRESGETFNVIQLDSGANFKREK
ncbi:MAG: hypothetical protein GY765_26180 [bacterium]|nr:hypothetical protein [bacterium]